MNVKKAKTWKAETFKVCRFSEFNPGNIYLFKSAMETLEKGVKYVQS